jgi:hypothetical protein
MPKLNFELAFATLLPEFIYQFLSGAGVVKDSITCLEFEDMREAIKPARGPECDGMKRFLALSEDAEEAEPGQPVEELTPEEKLEKMSEELDTELAEVDDELYHKYTPGELKYIFGEIVDNVDNVYGLFKEYTGVNMAYTIGFKLKNGLESNLVIEFLHLGDSPEYLEDVFFVPMKNYLVSDDIMVRIYLVYEKQKEAEYAAEFGEISKLLQLKGGEGQGGHEHSPGCGHIH